MKDSSYFHNTQPAITGQIDAGRKVRYRKKAMMWLLLAILNLTGYNFAFWSAMSVSRWVAEKFGRFDRSTGSTERHIQPHEVAVVMAAHNEETVLPTTLAALKKIVPAQNIYVGSDASDDGTVGVALRAGVHVREFRPNRGKAKVLVRLLKTFRLTQRFKAILLVDADVIVEENFLLRALPFFDDPKVAAVAGHAVSRWPKHARPRWSYFFTAYRIRLWRILQYSIRYGQSWGLMNMTTIVPGGSSIYRSTVLAQLDIAAPGLIIEDFNMTFEIHHRKLGKIAYHPRAYVIDQEPYSLRDYRRQVYRWHLGWWQTIRRHGIWPSWFWVSTGTYQIELLTYTAFTLALPLILALYLLKATVPATLQIAYLGQLISTLTAVPFNKFFVAIFLMDYLVTAVVAFIERKPILVVYGLGFFLLRTIDAATFLVALPAAWLTKSSGAWISPKRQKT